MRDEPRHDIRKPSGWLIPSALPGSGIAGGLVNDFDLFIAKYGWLLFQPSAQCARCGEDGYVWWAATSYREPVCAGEHDDRLDRNRDPGGPAEELPGPAGLGPRLAQVIHALPAHGHAILANPHTGLRVLGVDRHHTERRDDDMVDIGTRPAYRDGMQDMPAVSCGPLVQLAPDLSFASRALGELPGRSADP